MSSSKVLPRSFATLPASTAPMQGLWMLLASLLFAAMNALIKTAAQHHSLGEIVMFRGLPTVLAVGVWTAWTGHRIFHHNTHMHLRRTGAGLVGMWCGFYVTTQLPLATATTLNYTSPLFIALFLLLTGGFKANAGQWGSILLGFAGVVSVLKPTLTSQQLPVALLGLFTGVASAFAYMQVKALGRLGEPEWRTVMFFSSAAVLTGGALCIWTGQWHVYSVSDAGVLTGIGLTGGAAQLAMTRAFGKGSTWLSAALQYTTVLFSALIGMWVWGDEIHALSALGIALIMLCGGLSSYTAARVSARMTTSEHTPATVPIHKG